MEITQIGIFVLLITPLIFRFKRGLLTSIIVSIPFTATSIVNSGSGSALLVSQYFLILLVFSNAWILITDLKYLTVPRSLMPFTLFIVVCFLTIFSPILVDNNLLISNMQLGNEEYNSVLLNWYSFSRFIPLGMGWILVCGIYCNSSNPIVMIRTYLVGLIIFCFLGLIEYSISYYPSLAKDLVDVFVNAKHQYISTNPMSETLNIVRIKSASPEPSILAQSILTVYYYVAAAVFIRKYTIFNKVIDVLILMLLTLTIYLSGSTAGYIGILLSFVLVPLASPKDKKHQKVKKILAYAVLFTLISLLIYLLSPSFNASVTDIILSKRNTFSSYERIYSIVNSFEYFIDYPLFGLGWAQVTCHDLFVFLLANTGLFGLSAFLYSLYHLTKKTFKTVNASSNNKTTELLALYFNLIIFIVIMSITEFTYYFFSFYFLFGLVLASADKKYEKSNIKNIEYN